VGEPRARRAGRASIALRGKVLDASSDDDIERRFIDARNADYAEISVAAKQLAKKLKRRRKPDKAT
jgi:hypothetical protein